MTASKRTIIGLHFVTLFAMVFAFLPFSASATVPVVDDKAIGVLKDILKEDTQIKENTGSLVRKEYVLDPRAKALSALMLQFITKVIIGFVQQGGNTDFLGNLQAALTDIADQAGGEFLNQLAGVNLCAPFANPIRSALSRPVISLRDRLSCSVTDIFKNIQGSYQGFLGDFTQGGWSAYMGTLNGPNNYFDALISAYDAKLTTESRRTQIAQTQYQAGNGFLGMRIRKKDCSQALPDNTDSNGDLICPTVDIQTTPGHVISEQVVYSFNSGIQDIVDADEIGETLDQLFFFFINKLISSSWSGLASNNENSGIYDGALSGNAVAPPSPPLPADLYVSKLPTPNASSILAGDLVTFSGNITNQGPSAAATFSNQFQIDINNDKTVFATLNPSPTISYLAPYAGQSVTSGPWRAIEGTHRVILCADAPNSTVDELLENNNCDSKVFTVGPRPDLVVSQNPGIFSGTPSKDQVITFSGTIKNQGGSSTATSTFQNRFQIDLNNDGTTDVTLSPHPTIANLVTGATQSVISANWTSIEGTHRVILCADEPSPTIVESDETNNCSPVGTGVFTISPIPPPFP